MQINESDFFLVHKNVALSDFIQEPKPHYHIDSGNEEGYANVGTFNFLKNK